MSALRYVRTLLIIMAFFTTHASASAETVERLAGAAGEPALLIRHAPGPGPIVLYVHGSTFPSALSVAYRLDGRSWMDDLRARGFDVAATDADVAWYRARLTGVPGGGRDIKLPRGGHRMHLEDNRQALFDAVGSYIQQVAP